MLTMPATTNLDASVQWLATRPAPCTPHSRRAYGFDTGACLGQARSRCRRCALRWSIQRRSCSSRFALNRLRGMVSLLMVKLLTGLSAHSGGQTIRPSGRSFCESVPTTGKTAPCRSGPAPGTAAIPSPGPRPGKGWPGSVPRNGWWVRSA